MRNPKFEVFQSSKNSQYYFHLRSVNGEIILASEGYTSKQGCLNGVQSVKENSPFDEQYNRLPSKDDQFYFTLKAQNGEIIGVSEMYTTVAARENGIDAVKRDAPIAEVVEVA